jgi:hypothetical protein
MHGRLVLQLSAAEQCPACCLSAVSANLHFLQQQRLDSPHSFVVSSTVLAAGTASYKYLRHLMFTFAMTPPPAGPALLLGGVQ